MKSAFYLISNHILVYIYTGIHFILIISNVHKDLSIHFLAPCFIVQLSLLKILPYFKSPKDKIYNYYYSES